MGQRGWSGGQAKQWRDDSFVLVAATKRSLKGLANPKSANEAGNKETINLALVSLCLVRFLPLELLQGNFE